MDDVWIKGAKVPPDARRKRDGHSIFRSSRDRYRRNPDQIAGRRKGRMRNRRRIDSHVHALAQQIADQPVERLVGAVAHIIVIARKQGDAEIARLHGMRL